MGSQIWPEVPLQGSHNFNFFICVTIWLLIYLNKIKKKKIHKSLLNKQQKTLETWPASPIKAQKTTFSTIYVVTTHQPLHFPSSRISILV